MAVGEARRDERDLERQGVRRRARADVHRPPRVDRECDEGVDAAVEKVEPLQRGVELQCPRALLERAL